MSKIKFVLFDVDGTLVDSQHLIMQSIIGSCHELGIKPPQGRTQLLAGVGLPLKEALHHIIPELDAETLDKLVTTYREVQKKLLQTEQEMEPLYPGITDMLENLKQKNYALGIVTSKARRILQGALDRNKITHYFASIKTPDDGPGKPDPFLLQQAMNENQFGPQETIYVGDTIFDMQAARAAKVQSLGVTWGYHMRKDLIDAGAHKIIERVDEISPAVTAWKLQA